MSKCFWRVWAAAWTTLILQGAARAQEVPRNSVVFAWTGLYGGAVGFDHRSGPYDLMSGRNVFGYSIAAGILKQVGSGRYLIRTEVEYFRLPFTFNWQVNAKEVYGVERVSRKETYQAERMGLLGVWMGMDYALSPSTSPLLAKIALGVGWSQLDFYPQFGALIASDPDDPSVRYNIFTMTSEHRNGFVPLFRVGLGKEWRLNNQNSLGVTAFVQWSWVDDFNSGTYVAYPGTLSESSGTWKQGLDYLGFSVHYAMGFGPGKVPRYLRNGP